MGDTDPTLRLPRFEVGSLPLGSPQFNVGYTDWTSLADGGGGISSHEMRVEEQRTHLANARLRCTGIEGCRHPGKGSLKDSFLFAPVHHQIGSEHSPFKK